VIAWAMSAGGGIRWGYWLLGLYVVPIVIWLMRMPSPVHAEASAAATALRPVNWRLTGLIMLLMLLYVGAEVGVAGWLYTYAVTLDLASTTSAAYLTSVFWGALTAGRLLAIPIAARFRPRTILLVDLLGSIGSVALMVFVQDRAWALWVGALSVGLFMASIFPTVIVWAERRMRMSGTVTSMFLVGASLGAMFVPWLIGQMFEARGPGITMVAVLVTLILALGVFLVVMANGGTPHPELNEEV
jgi:FHS family Na+ dependent glucose MFS transporter 1